VTDNSSSESKPNRLPRFRRYFVVLKEFLFYWNKNTNFFLSLFLMLFRWIFATWIFILAVTTTGLIIVFLSDPSAFKDPTDRKQECVTIERSDGTAFDSCDLLVP
jgi:hypothetical protein